MDKVTVWQGKYRDIGYKICHWRNRRHDNCWSYYIYLTLKQLEPDVRDDIWIKPTNGKPRLYLTRESDLLTSLYWHGDCVYYKKHGHDGLPRVVEVGCDYQHLFDNNEGRGSTDVLEDVLKTIDSLHEQTMIKRFCIQCGKYFYPRRDEQTCSDCKEK